MIYLRLRATYGCFSRDIFLFFLIVVVQPDTNKYILNHLITTDGGFLNKTKTYTGNTLYVLHFYSDSEKNIIGEIIFYLDCKHVKLGGVVCSLPLRRAP